MTNSEAAQKAITAALAQHSAYLYRANTGAANEQLAAFNRDTKALLASLAEQLEELTDAERMALASASYSTVRLKEIKATVDDWYKSLAAGLPELFTAGAIALAGHEVSYIAEAMAKATGNAKDIALTGEKVFKAAKKLPVTGGQLIDQMFSKIAVQAQDTVWNTIRQGVVDGQSNSDIIKALRGKADFKYQDSVLEPTRRNIDTMVRTARNHISNNAYNDTYAALGVEEVVFVSVLDSRTSKVCASLDGTHYKINEPHPKPPMHPNCLLGDSLVLSGSEITGASERWFDGEVVTIKSASGFKLTCTPNHPILTDRGWVGAGLLDVGSNIVCDSRSEWRCGGSWNNQDMPATIKEEFNSFSRSSEMIPVPVPVAPEHFHNDGAGSEVAVVFSECLLGRSGNSTLKQHLSKVNLTLRDSTLSISPAECAFNQSSFRLNCTAQRLIGGFGKSLPLLKRGVSHSCRLLFRSVAGGNAVLFKNGFGGSNGKAVPSKNAVKANAGLKHINHLLFGKIAPKQALINSLLGFGSNVQISCNKVTADNLLSDLQTLRNSVLAFTSNVASANFTGIKVMLKGSSNATLSQNLPDSVSLDAVLASDITNGNFGKVFCDNVVSVKRSNFSGHVCNLETEKGFYIANGIITHNCRSVIAPVFSDDLIGNRPSKGSDGIKQVGANTNFASWFKEQSTEFKREWLGESRLKLYETGKFPLDRFVDPIGKEYTLKQLEIMDKKTFKDVFG